MIAMSVESLDAATLAPSKPSDVRVLELGAACAALGTFALDTRVHGDGTTSRFSIPDKQALILDSVTWVVNGVAIRYPSTRAAHSACAAAAARRSRASRSAAADWASWTCGRAVSCT